jgi:hypothetical protein
MSIWDAVVTPRRVVVYSPRPVDEARAIVRALVDDGARMVPSRTTRGVRFIDGEVDGARVWFSASTRPGPEAGADSEPPTYGFTGTLEGGDDGSVLSGSITTPMTFGVPAAGLTVLLALFLLWGGLPVPLVAIGTVAWIFLTIVVIASLQEQRLRQAEGISQLLEEVLA